MNIKTCEIKMGTQEVSRIRVWMEMDKGRVEK
jgi:hypothetical protein